MPEVPDYDLNQIGQDYYSVTAIVGDSANAYDLALEMLAVDESILSLQQNYQLDGTNEEEWYHQWSKNDEAVRFTPAEEEAYNRYKKELLGDKSGGVSYVENPGQEFYTRYYTEDQFWDIVLPDHDGLIMVTGRIFVAQPDHCLLLAQDGSIEKYEW